MNLRKNSVKPERLNDPLGFLVLAPLAQLAEHRTLNPQVLGSSPRGRTTDKKPRHSANALNAEP